MQTTYRVPVASDRPHGSFRFDVYSLKARRPVTLFGEISTLAFLDLESDPAVTDLCERPDYIEGSKPKKLIDFWAIKSGQINFYIIHLGKESPEILLQRSVYKDFLFWAEKINAKVVVITKEAFVNRRFRYFNLAKMLQAIKLHDENIHEKLKLLENPRLPKEFNLSQAESILLPQDPALARVLVYGGVIGGALTFPGINEMPLNAYSDFRKNSLKEGA